MTPSPTDPPPTSQVTGADTVVRDADQLPAGDWPQRPLRAGIDGRQSCFQVIFGNDVIDDIRAHGLASPDAEVCGVLVGNICRDSHGHYCDIHANIRGNHASGRNAQVTFTADTWTHIQQTMDSRFPSDRIVGWYHTHPGFGIFLSEMDVFIHENFFGEPWQVAYVDDPKGGDRGVFVWEHNVPVRRPYLMQPAPGESFPAEPPATVAPTDPLTASARRRTLEREKKMKRRGNGLLIVLLFLLIVSTILYLFGERLLHYLPAQLR
jgi:proteasome lid subunit RPN8/RPN11